MPKGKGNGTQCEWFATEFMKRTEGRYKVETYPASTLVPLGAVLDSVKKGVAEMATTPPTMFSKDLPLSQISSMPMLGFPTRKQATLEAQRAAMGIWREFALVPEIAAEYKPWKLAMAWFGTPSNLFSKKKEIHYPADLRGIRLAGAGPSADLAANNGGAGVAILVPEYYESLDKGVVDAAVMNTQMCTDWRMQTIINYYYMLDIGTGPFVLLMNLDFWKAMLPQDQKIFDDTINDMAEWGAASAQKQIADSEKILADAGKTLTYPTPAEVVAWQRGSEVCFRKWRDDCISMGIEAKTCDKVQNAWMALRDKYIEKYNLK